tara:strand:+ start:392 stop:1024 length:633 start_codon:yes stop_codon:yes gene_type:complete
MKKLIILGAANPNVIRTIDSINSKKNKDIFVECFVDNDKKKIGKKFMKKDVLDTQTFLKTYSKNDCYLFNSIASSTQIRKDITEFYKKKGFQFQSIIHPDIDTNYTKIGSGVFLQENSIVQANVRVSDFVIVSSNSCIAHDSSIGKFTFIGPAVYICGRVEVGESCYIGVGAKILPDVKIGKNSIIAAGSIVNKNIKANSRVIGMPARVF